MKESKYTKELLETCTLKVKSMSDLVRLLTDSEKVHGSMTKLIKDKLVLYDIDFSHFKGSQGKRKTSSENSLEYIKENYLSYPSKLTVGSHTLKKWLYKYNILKEECSLCNLGTVWNNKLISLQLDHIDGNSLNNNLENLRILCPNCHSQTDTFSGKNNKIKR